MAIILTDEEVEYLRCNYGRLSNREIADHLYIHAKTVGNIVKRYNVKPVPKPTEPPPVRKGRGTRWTDSDRHKLRRMIDDGCTWPEIASALNRSVKAVSEYKYFWLPGYPSPKHQSRIRKRESEKA